MTKGKIRDLFTNLRTVIAAKMPKRSIANTPAYNEPRTIEKVASLF
jgi:hypothetical protein